MNTLIVKRTVLAGIAALTITAAGLGVVGVQQTLAATSTPTSTTDGHGDRAAMHDKFMAAVVDKLNAAAGTKITGDQLKQAFTDARTAVGAPDHTAGGWQGHPGGGPGGQRGGPNGGPGGFLKPAADKIGIPLPQLFQEWQGSTLTKVATAHGADPKAVAQALTDAEYARIDQEVTDGKILKSQVSDAQAWAKDRVANLMNMTKTAQQGRHGFDQNGPQNQTGGFGPRGFHQQADGFQFQHRSQGS